ncbi:hypothetical protein OG936_01700 [Streptomyces sp. NBC_00846]|uniref:hypothetical protein n=1 Tax=Streptomyces sp. NBC_00846 TaxID=2975849 RepID=UPI0038702AAF|nr:hypothetical protein OG936_01700 [Streptomyces sp. NBC_00846]
MTTQLGPAQIPTGHGFRMTYVVAVFAAVVGLLLTLAIPRAGTAARHAGHQASRPADAPATAGNH